MGNTEQPFTQTSAAYITSQISDFTLHQTQSTSTLWDTFSSNPYTKENTFPIFPHFRFIGTLLLKKANYRINNVQNIHTQGCFQISHNNPNKPTMKPKKKKKNPTGTQQKHSNQSSNSPNSQSPFHLQLIKCNKWKNPNPRNPAKKPTWLIRERWELTKWG